MNCTPADGFVRNFVSSKVSHPVGISKTVIVECPDTLLTLITGPEVFFDPEGTQRVIIC